MITKQNLLKFKELQHKLEEIEIKERAELLRLKQKYES